MEISNNYPLQELNTFGIKAFAEEYIEIHTINELETILKTVPHKPKFILGGGSNLLITQDINALVIKISINGKRIIKEDETHVWIEGNAGENWHQFVLWTIENNWGGLENLSYIPGQVGTTPIQNIGAYGVEIKDHLEWCNTLSMDGTTHRKFSAEDCKFSYRESIFKQEEKNQWIITSVVFKLTKIDHQLKTDYGAIEEELKSQQISTPTLKDVSSAVTRIRMSKLPNPEEIGNSGSFFKNPIISLSLFNKLKVDFPNLPHYPIDDNHVKVPAGWLIEHTGYKGFRRGDAGVHKQQALVLVNYGNANGEQILALAREIQEKVFEKFGIKIETEVNIL